MVQQKNVPLLEIFTFGGLQIRCGGKSIKGLASRKAEALLIYLAVTRRPQQREVLADFFWEGSTQSQAMNNLRTVLSSLRKQLDAYLSINRYTVALNLDSNFWFDVNELKNSQNLADGAGGFSSPKIVSQIKTNLDLYQGEFLEGFFIRGCSSFENWLVSERELMKELVTALLQELVDFNIENENYEAGITLIKNLLRVTPYLESAHRQLMCLLVYENQREAALAQFETCKRILKSELGIEPSNETKALFEVIHTGVIDTSLAATLPERPSFLDQIAQEEPVFVGREDQLTQLDFHLAKAMKGEGRMVLVRGEAGSGKTALVSEFARRALGKHSNLLVASGRCNAIYGQGDAYLPLNQVVEILCCIKKPEIPGTNERLWDVFPHTLTTVLTRGSDLLDRLINSENLMSRALAIKAKNENWVDPLKKLIQAESKNPKVHNSQFLIDKYNSVLVALSSRNPLLIILDDLQWVDNASSNLLFHLIRNISDSHILIIGMYRPSEVFSKTGGSNPFEPLIHEVKAHFGEIEIDLDSISDNEAKSFVEMILDVENNLLDANFRKNLFDQTRGHPLFTIELLKDMKDRGDIKLLGNEGWVTNSDLKWGKLPTQIEGVIAARLARLDDWSREILEVASVIGEEFDSQILAQVLNRDGREIHRTLVKKLGGQHRLILEIGKKQNPKSTHTLFRFSHNLFQIYLYSGLGEGQQRLTHKAIAHTLENHDPANLQALAYHYSKTEDIEKAIHFLLLVADKARHQYANKEAIDYYLQALEFIGEISDLEKASHTWMKLALTYQNNFNFTASDKAYAKAFSLQTTLSESMRNQRHPPAPHPLRLIYKEPATIDPTFCRDVYSQSILAQLFSGLVQLSTTGDILPDVAQSWDVLDGGKRFVFHLRKDSFWSDGVPVTAGDFEFAIKRVLSPITASSNAVFLYEIKNARLYHKGYLSDPDLIGIYTKDNYTLEFELDSPTAYFLQLLGSHQLLPVPQHSVEKFGKNWTEIGNFTSNGAFQLASWVQGEYLMLKKKPRYHGLFGGNLQSVEIIFTNQVENALQAYLDADFDILQSELLTREQQVFARQYLSDEFFSAPMLGTSHLSFNTHSAPFDDPKVRRAFAFAIDRNSIIGQSFPWLASPANGGLLPPGIPGHSPNIGLPFDPDRARFLLAEAGFPGGKGFPATEGIYYSKTGEGPNFLILKELQAQWLEILGIQVNWNYENMKVRYLRPHDKKPSLLITGWVADYYDPHNFFVDASWNRLQDQKYLWGHQEFNRLIKKAKVVLNQEERINYYMQADRILVEEAPIIPLFHYNIQGLQKPWVKGLTYSAKGEAQYKDVIIKEH